MQGAHLLCAGEQDIRNLAALSRGYGRTRCAPLQNGTKIEGRNHCAPKHRMARTQERAQLIAAVKRGYYSTMRNGRGRPRV